MKIFDLLRQDEGLKTTVYKDTLGYWTVGIGHLLTKDPSKIKAIAVLDALVGRSTKGTITVAESQKIFEADVINCITDITRNATLFPIYKELDSDRQNGLINMVFQMGVTGVSKFKVSLGLVSSKQYDAAAKNFRLSKWYKQTPNRAERVINTICYGSYKLYGVK